MKLVLVASAALLLGVLLGLDHVRNRFEHGPRSRRVLAVEAILSYFLALYITIRLLPWPAHLSAPLAVAVALPLFTLMAVVTVEAWRMSRQQEFDAHIARIEREITDVMEKRDEVQRQLIEARRNQSKNETQASSQVFRRRQLRSRVDDWAQEGGLARIRSLKLEDWQRDLENSEPGEIRSRIENLEDQARRASDGGDSERVEQARVQMALAELQLMGSGQAGPKSPSGPGDDVDIDKKVDDLTQRAEEYQARMQELEEELAEWRGKKRFFLDQKLRLD